MLCMLLVTACSEHIETDSWQTPTEQEGNVKLVIGSDALLPTTRTSTDTEKSIDVIKTYWLLFYKNDGSDNYTLVKRQQGTANTALKVETTALLEEGTYHAYVVANIDDNKIPTEGSSESALWEIQLDWTNSDISQNQTMFGFFTKEADTPGNDLVTDLDNSIDVAVNKDGLHKVNPTTHKAPEIIIESTKIQAKLTAKLYRMAAMVSLHIDTWDLNPGVELTLQSVKLYNIPNKYYLWKESAANATDGVAEDEINANIGFEHNASHPIKHYHTDNGITNYTDNIYTLNQFFYLPENRQGTVNTTSLNDKTAGAGKAKEYATYIEVVAKHKINDTNERTVTYRYALGEDSYGDNGTIVYNNYNVTRNRHYKVYLTLKGYGLSSAATWRTELGTETFTPFVEITGNKIRLVDYKGNTVSATSWSVENTNSWLHLRKTAAINKDTDKNGTDLKMGTGISDGTGNVEFYYYGNCSSGSYALDDLSGTITLTYKVDDEEKTQEISLKRFSLFKFNNSSTWTSFNQYIEPSGSGNGPVYYNVCIDEKPWNKDAVYSLNFYNGIKTEEDMQVFTGNVHLLWPGPYRNSDVNSDYSKGEFTYKLISDVRLNGYYTFDIYTSVLNFNMPTPVTILKNAPFTISNIVADAKFENSALSNITGEMFSLVKPSTDGSSQYNNSTDPQIPTINDVKYPYHFNIKNSDTYIEFTIDSKRTLNVIGRGHYDNVDNGYMIYKVVDGTETSVQKVLMPPSNHIRNYTKELSAGTYRIRKITTGEIYLYYLALN